MVLSIIQEELSVRENLTKRKLAYSVEEVAQQTTLSKAFLRNEIRAGRLKANRFGRRVLVLNEDLENYLIRGSYEKESV